MMRSYKTSVPAVMLSIAVATAVIAAAPAFSQGRERGQANRTQNAPTNQNINRGVTASSLGALNAAHANATALANASANSEIGMIALYKEAVMASAEAAGLVGEAEDALAAYLLAEFEAGFISSYETYEEYLEADPAPTEEEILYWETINALQQDIDDAIADAEIAEALEAQMLEMAANKETNESVIDALWALLE